VPCPRGPAQIDKTRTNPDEFLRNIRQFTNPAAFQDRLLDIAAIPAIRIRVVAGSTLTLNVMLPAS